MEPQTSNLYLADLVDEMVNTFQVNLIDGEVSGEGLAELSDLFMTSPIELRAYVYRAFVQELNDKGLAHDFQCTMGDA